MVLQSVDGEKHHTAPMLFGLRAVMLGRQGSGKGTQGLQLARLLAGLWPRIPTDRIAQLAGVSEPVPTESAASPADEDLSALAVEVVIEVPRGSRNKYEFDHERHVLHLDRRLFSATVYPADKALEPGKSTSTTGFEGREAALGEIAASRARLLHHQRAGEPASQRVPREATQVVGGLVVDLAARSRAKRRVPAPVKVRMSRMRRDLGPSWQDMWPVLLVDRGP